MSGLVALAALDTLGRARLGAVGSFVALLLTVFTGEWVHALLGAVAGAVTDLVTVDALNGGLDRLVLGNLLLTVLLEELATKGG